MEMNKIDLLNDNMKLKEISNFCRAQYLNALKQ